MLQISELTYSIDKRPLIDNADLTLPAGARAGLVGRNGAGKTTLFRLIAGELIPDTGSIALPRNTRIGQVTQEAPSGDKALIEVVLAADGERTSLLAAAETATEPHGIADIHTRLADIEAHSAEARAAAILAGLGFDAPAQSRPCAAFSGGWRMRAALAAVLFAAPDLLLLDEPSNYLDLEGTLWLESYLARYPRTVIVISHDRDLLNRAVRTIVHLDRGKLTLYRGGYDSFERQRRERQALESSQAKKQEAQRRHMQAFVDRFRAKASKARQARSRLKALAKLEPIVPVVDESVTPFRFPAPARPLAPPIVVMEDVSVGYEPGRPVLRRLNLRIDDDDRIGLLGANGNGKSTFAKLVAGRLAPFGGVFKHDPKLQVAYFAQHQLDELDPAQSAYDHARARLPDAGEARARARVDGMGLSRAKMDTPASDLSGGEKARLLMGLATIAGANLLILDEPTNHLDVDSRAALIEALAEFSGAVILISHDRHLIETSVERLWLVADGTVRPFDGDLDDYRRSVLDSRPAAAARRSDRPPGAPAHRQRRREAAERRQAAAPLRRRIDAIEQRVAGLNKEIGEIDRKLASPDLYAHNPTDAAFLAKARADAARKLATAEEEWLAAVAVLEKPVDS
jgi:ATP-binding cassette subfamily F protein 3